MTCWSRDATLAGARPPGLAAAGGFATEFSASSAVRARRGWILSPIVIDGTSFPLGTAGLAGGHRAPPRHPPGLFPATYNSHRSKAVGQIKPGGCDGCDVEQPAANRDGAAPSQPTADSALPAAPPLPGLPSGGPATWRAGSAVDGQVSVGARAMLRHSHSRQWSTPPQPVERGREE